MRNNIFNRLIYVAVGCIFWSSAFAGVTANESGISVGSKGDPYWFQIGGSLKLDERLYFGTKTATPAATTNPGAGTYNSGAFIRDAGISFNGGVGEDFSFTLALDFQTNSNGVRIDDAFLTYHGFRNVLPNLSLSFGQVVPGFCLTCAESSKWIPFMERSMATTTFGPQNGLGVNANTYNDSYSATIAITQQPKSGDKLKTLNGADIRSRDVWQASGRFTYAAINQPEKVLQFGLSSHIREYSNHGLQFSPMPEMRSGGMSETLLNTTPIGGQLISAKHQTTLDAEVLGIYGPWSAMAEYQQAFITRGINDSGVKQGQNLKFKGYHAQVAYVLTGESRPLKASNGTLGQIKPRCKTGAWEVAARYSFLDLNDKDITGGMAHNTTASLSWYANNNIRVIGEYVNSKQSRAFGSYTDKRTVNSVGARIQVVF